ncbi:MAG: [protein-PII] uridylyltransferase [Rickettsiales bacterium]
MRSSATAPIAAPLPRGAKASAFAEYCKMRALALEQFARHSRIQPLWRGLTDATDGLLAAHAPASTCVIAVGGYGRRELFPHSDVDILLLVAPDAPASATAALISMLQQLWDMQIPVSHAVRHLDETISAARGDHSIAAALMDARLVSGDRRAYLVLKKRLKAEVFGADKRTFVADKLRDRDVRHRKWGDSRFMLEPNIKDGKGGLRDLHTLNWLARYCYGVAKASELVRTDLLNLQEWKRYRDAYLFFATLRAHMHMLRGRADERLSFDLQTQIATILKFRGRTAQEKAGRLMLRYFQFAREVGALTRIFCAILEDENHRTLVSPLQAQSLANALPQGFTLDGGRLNFSPDTNLTAMPAATVTIFALAQQHGLDIHPRGYLAISRALPQLSRKLSFEGEANRQLQSILLARAPDITLRRMSECGLLGALLPEFGRVVGMMQYDGYHTYTVDEHTLVAVGNLASIEAHEWTERFPLTSQVAAEIIDRGALYLAMLGHDLAKGTGGAHAEKGEAIVARIGARLGLNVATAELAGWLVAHHLIFSDTAFRRDLDDPQTIADFVAVVQSPERLRLLLLITVADIKAVGPTIWNGWKGALMRELYRRAMVHMGVGDSADDIATAQQKLLVMLQPTLQQTAQQFFAQRIPAGWWLREPDKQLETIEAYAAWVKNPTGVALRITHDRFRAISELTCCLSHQPGLFRVLAGVMALSGASIVSARIMVLADGAAIATLGIQDIHGNSFADEEKRVAGLPGMIAQALAGRLDIAGELPNRGRLLPERRVAIEPQIFIDNQVSAQASVVEINAPDRIGLLHDIIAALEQCQLQVMTAHAATYGARAVDVFYVKDNYGFKMVHQAKIAAVQQALIHAIAGAKDEA